MKLKIHTFIWPLLLATSLNAYGYGDPNAVAVGGAFNGAGYTDLGTSVVDNRAFFGAPLSYGNAPVALSQAYPTAYPSLPTALPESYEAPASVLSAPFSSVPIGGIVGGSSLGAIPIVRNSKLDFVNVPSAAPLQPANLVVNSPLNPISLIYRSFGAPIQIIQRHIPAKGTVKQTAVEEEPHRHLHTVKIPIIQEIREIIAPLRVIKKEILPVQEQVSTTVAKAVGSNQAVLGQPLYNPASFSAAGLVSSPFASLFNNKASFAGSNAEFTGTPYASAPLPVPLLPPVAAPLQAPLQVFKTNSPVQLPASLPSTPERFTLPQPLNPKLAKGIQVVGNDLSCSGPGCNGLVNTYNKNRLPGKLVAGPAIGYASGDYGSLAALGPR